MFDVAVISSDPNLNPAGAQVSLSSKKQIVDRQQWDSDQLAKIKGVNYRILADTAPGSPVRMFALDEAFDLHFYLRIAQALEVSQADINIKVKDSRGQQAEQAVTVPIRYYQQKVELYVPFHGQGAVGQDWITNGGHGGRIGNDFALDLRGLSDNFAEQNSQANENASSNGWGREILAPAAGIVTYARNDVPDNAHPGSAPDMSYYSALHDPVMARYGNCVVIDHGGAECSLLAHMQLGSVKVHVGDRVVQGQVIGRLGNSGDAFGPHLHYQLQTGRTPYAGQSLPFKFQGAANPLHRGSFVTGQ